MIFRHLLASPAGRFWCRGLSRHHFPAVGGTPRENDVTSIDKGLAQIADCLTEANPIFWLAVGPYRHNKLTPMNHLAKVLVQ
jgi:hypothetical protein